MIKQLDKAVVQATYNWTIETAPAGAKAERDSNGLLRFTSPIVTLRDHNVVTTAGLSEIISLITGSGTAFTHFAIGSDNTAAAAGQTALLSEEGRSTFTSTVLGSSSVTWQYLLPATELNGTNLYEAGIFNAASGGTMLNRYTYSVVEKTSAIQALYTVVLTIS